MVDKYFMFSAHYEKKLKKKTERARAVVLLTVFKIIATTIFPLYFEHFFHYISG